MCCLSERRGIREVRKLTQGRLAAPPGHASRILRLSLLAQPQGLRMAPPSLFVPG